METSRRILFWGRGCRTREFWVRGISVCHDAWPTLHFPPHFLQHRERLRHKLVEPEPNETKKQLPQTPQPSLPEQAYCMRPKIVHQADGWNVACPANIAVRIVASSRREGRGEIDDQRMSVLLCSFGLCHLKVVHGFESYFVAGRPVWRLCCRR